MIKPLIVGRCSIKKWRKNVPLNFYTKICVDGTSPSVTNRLYKHLRWQKNMFVTSRNFNIATRKLVTSSM